MSRIGKKPVAIGSAVDVTIGESLISVKGALGALSLSQSPLVKIDKNVDSLTFSPIDSSRQASAMSGTLRQLIANMLYGVRSGFDKKLQLVGVGYKAHSQNNELTLTVGFSHPVTVKMPEGIRVETPSPTEILIKGVDKQRVGKIASEIRAVRPPEPYKGKGIRYADEKIIIKETKKK